MIHAAPLLLLAGTYLLVLASPGPNFFILSQLALAGRQREARFVVLGLTTGSIIWVATAMTGLSALLTQLPWLASVVRTVGALYLIWYGARLMWSVATSSGPMRDVATLQARQERTPLLAWRTGLLTGVTNPKGAAFWTSAFAATFPAHAPLWLCVATLAMIATLSIGWHFAITVVFASRPLRAAYLRVGRTINAVAGAALLVVGVQRLVDR